VPDTDRLYGLPLEEFVRERTALARALRKEGRRAEAASVEELTKPSVAAWAVNQLARTRRADVKRLLEAADRLRRIQTGGKGDFAEASRAVRAATDALVEAAADLLRDAGRPASDAALARVGKTLQAAAADEVVRALLERGTLVRELEPAGFGGLLEAMPKRPRAARTAKRPSAKEREASQKAKDAARQRRREADVAERELEAARRALERAERAAAKARAQAEKSG
jgi:hypothetical protein